MLNNQSCLIQKTKHKIHVCVVVFLILVSVHPVPVLFSVSQFPSPDDPQLPGGPRVAGQPAVPRLPEVRRTDSRQENTQHDI